MFTAFHIMRAMALGADTVNSARGMMLALGCIQSRTCNTDHCPTGIATQNPSRNKAIVVTDKAQRVANFHHETVKNLVELVGAAGLNNVEELRPEHVNRRVQGTDVKHYGQLYPQLTSGCLLDTNTMPVDWKYDWHKAQASSW
jgi:glutamate synthase domain-containing protein 2